MASNYNINLPDGSTVPVPAWATEDTLQQLQSVINKNNLSVDIITDLMQENNMDVSNVANKMAQLANTERKEVAQRLSETKKQSKAFGQKLTSVLDKFNSTDKPLTSLVDMAGGLGSQIKDSAGSMGKDKAKITKGAGMLSKSMGMLSKGLGIAGDVGAVYAGWVAGKAEEFAKAQQNMIDSGAIYFENAAAFNALQTQARDAGIGYEKFTTIVGNYGAAMVGLGGSVSNGAVEFAVLSERLNDASDQFGDFGMTSEALAEGFAEFIETQRLSGSIDRSQADYGDKLVKSYQNLLIETGSYASATAFTRKQLLEAYSAGMSDTNFAGAMNILEREGDKATIEAAKSIQTQLYLLKEGGVTELSEPLIAAFSQAVSANAGNMENFDIVSFLQANGGETVLTTLQTANSDLLDKINRSMRSGQKLSGDMLQELQQSFAEMNNTVLIPAGAQDGPLGAARRAQAQMEIFRKMTEKTVNMTEKEREELKKKHQKDIAGAGQLTKTMNDVTEGYLKAMDALTPPMDTFGKMLDKVTTGLSNITTQNTSDITTNTDMGVSDVEWDFGAAAGARVKKGETGIIGEQGPEIFVPDTNGTVLPNYMLDMLSNSMYTNNSNLLSANMNDTSLNQNKLNTDMINDADANENFDNDSDMMAELDELVKIKTDSVMALKNLDGMLTKMFGLTRERAIASEMS